MTKNPRMMLTTKGTTRGFSSGWYPTLTILILLLACACQKTPQDMLRAAIRSAGTGDYEGAEEKYRWLVQHSPNDDHLKANLAFMLTKQGKHVEAITIYEDLIKGGDGTYDLFAYYADSLQGVGRRDDAIIWNYRSLSVVPSLVDVRGTLAKLLVKAGRPYEALSLLASFDDSLAMRSQAPYFEAQRMSIQAGLADAIAVESRSMIAANLDGHFYSVVSGNSDTPLSFMIDTGASHTSMSAYTLKKLGYSIPGNAKHVTMLTADGRKVDGQLFPLPKLKVGPLELENVPVFVTEYGMPLLGQSALAQFDLSTEKKGSTEFMIFKKRGNQ